MVLLLDSEKQTRRNTAIEKSQWAGLWVWNVMHREGMSGTCTWLHSPSITDTTKLKIMYIWTTTATTKNTQERIQSLAEGRGAVVMLCLLLPTLGQCCRPTRALSHVELWGWLHPTIGYVYRLYSSRAQRREWTFRELGEQSGVCVENKDCSAEKEVEGSRWPHTWSRAGGT